MPTYTVMSGIYAEGLLQISTLRLFYKPLVYMSTGTKRKRKKKEDEKWRDLAHSFLFGSVLLRYFDLIRRQILKNF